MRDQRARQCVDEEEHKFHFGLAVSRNRTDKYIIRITIQDEKVQNRSRGRIYGQIRDGKARYTPNITVE